MNAHRRTVGLVAALVLSAGLLAGWRAGAASAGRGTTSTGSTGTTITEPSVTAVTTPTIPVDQLPGTGRPVVHLADGNVPEQFIIGQLYAIALTHEGYTVILSRNLGPSYERVPA